MSYADDEPLEHTLLVVREVSVYKVPRRVSSGGYKCGEWLQSDKIWTGRLKVVSLNDACDVRLEDSNTGELFAECHVMPGKRDVMVENVVDSSRYFVLKIDDGNGKHAFIGLGFAERNEAFDFNVALSDHEKHVKRETEKEEGRGSTKEDASSQPSLDLRLKVTTVALCCVLHGKTYPSIELELDVHNFFFSSLCNCRFNRYEYL